MHSNLSGLTVRTFLCKTAPSPHRSRKLSTDQRTLRQFNPSVKFETTDPKNANGFLNDECLNEVVDGRRIVNDGSAAGLRPGLTMLARVCNNEES
jgi:hypothetical protein